MDTKELMKVEDYDLVSGSFGWLMLSLKMKEPDGAGFVNFGARRLATCHWDENGNITSVDQNPKAMEEILRIMDVLGACDLSGVVGKKAYVYFKDNICYKIESLDGKKSFDYYEFYKED